MWASKRWWYRMYREGVGLDGSLVVACVVSRCGTSFCSEGVSAWGCEEAVYHQGWFSVCQWR